MLFFDTLCRSVPVFRPPRSILLYPNPYISKMDQSFGFHIRKIRNDGGISVGDLAHRTGISEGEIHKIEAGAITASRDQVFRLANHFNADENDIIKLNQVTKIQSAPFKHSRLATERIDNMKKDLSFLESRNVIVRMHVPTPALVPFIESILYCKGHNLGRAYETAIPDGTAQLQVVVGDSRREMRNPLTKRVQQLRNAWVIGINNVPITYNLSDTHATIYVRFKPGGLYAFAKVHQATLNNAVVDANMLLGSTVDELHAAILNDKTPDESLERVERYFLELLKIAGPRPALLDYMLDNINVPLVQLAKSTGYSSKYLTKTFQKYVGVGPKSLQRIQRFSRAMKYLNQLTGNVDWAHIVCEYGYHDQAHFIKDFKEFTGFSPLNYLALGGSCIHYFHSNVNPDALVNKRC